jgi:Virulence protein RhuM family/Fic/DOC family
MTQESQVYQTETGELQVRLDVQEDTVWLTQAQMMELFASSKANISEHLKHIFASQELSKSATVRKYRTVQNEGSREVARNLEHYNLDVIIAVGYRVNTRRGTEFRQWATRTLREHLTRGFTINQQRLRQNAQEFEAALALVRQVAQHADLSGDMGRGLVDVVTRYAQTFLWLQQYDQGVLTDAPTQVGGVLPTLEEARQALARLKADLMNRGEATELFALERGDGFEALLGNLNQSVFGEPAYPSIESKAAHLLYFVIKNHPFADGNKRSGAFLFMDFLNQNHRLLDKQSVPVINEIGLASLALLIAESASEQKEVMIQLVMNMLSVGYEPAQGNQV